MRYHDLQFSPFSAKPLPPDGASKTSDASSQASLRAFDSYAGKR